MMRGVMAGFLVVGLAAGSALADASQYLGTWVNTARPDSGFLDGLVGAKADDIARIVTTPAGVTAIRIHLYGRCQPECDWGTAIGHNHSAAANSDAVESISADFVTGAATKRLTLRKGPGQTLNFEVVTDFTDHSSRHDYVASGSLRLAPALIAEALPAAPGAPTAGPPPVAAASDGEDCERINPNDLYVAPSDRGWKVNDYNHTVLNFGSDKVGAAKAAKVLEYYRFDEQCYVGRPHPAMIYWRNAGSFPRQPMPGADCVDLHPEAISQHGGKLLDGDRTVADFGTDEAAAAKAISVLRTYHVARQCYLTRASQVMVYWLSK